MTPPLPNNLRTREATNAKWSAKKRVVETTKLSAPRTRRRRLVKGPSQRKQYSIDKVCSNIQSSPRLSSFKFWKYDTLDNYDKNRIEEAMIKIMSNFRLSPSEMERQIP